MRIAHLRSPWNRRWRVPSIMVAAKLAGAKTADAKSGALVWCAKPGAAKMANDAQVQAPGFVHLHVHSSYSLLEGALTIARLAELAKKDRQPALALTDTDNMFGALEFSEKMAGVRHPADRRLRARRRFRRSGKPRAGRRATTWPRIVLLAAREDGYRSLMRLSSRAFLETAPHERPHMKLAWLDGETDGLIALTGGPDGPLDVAIAAGQTALALARCDELQRLFGDRLYIELQRHGMAERAHGRAGADRARLCAAAFRSSPPTSRSSPRARITRPTTRCLCIAEGQLVADGDRRQLTAEHRFKTRAEMAALFADLPEALAATVEIAERCAFRPRHAAPILPRFSAGTRRRRVGRGASELRQRRRSRPRSGAWSAHGLAPGRTDRGLSRAARLRARRHRAHEVSRLLPDRRRFHPVGEGAGHSGRARPRLRRRLAGRLRAHHHRSRSAPLRPPVRALPQSRARVDAGLRHRLLPGPARRGDPLRAGASTAATRSRRSSPSARCRRAACCATSAACCRCPTARSTSSASWCRRIRPTR